MFFKSLTCYRHGKGRGLRSGRGFSMLELMIVIAISVAIAGYAIPMFLNGYYTIRLKSAATDLSGLLQKARIQAARENSVFSIQYRTSTVQEAYVDMNNDGAWENAVTINGVQQSEPIIDFNQSIIMAPGAPPTPYVLVGDTAGVVYTNTTILGWSARGLPCAYAGGVCTTPAAGYFVYYLNDRRPTTTGWAAVVISRSGRSKVVVWNGNSWQ
jgi:prepilin-type N-terminal cleavage/methylation domain-containing protein